MLIGTASTARTQHHAPSQSGVRLSCCVQGCLPSFYVLLLFSCLYWLTGYMLNHVDTIDFFCYMVGSTFLGHDVQFFACEPRVLFHCFSARASTMMPSEIIVSKNFAVSHSSGFSTQRLPALRQIRNLRHKSLKVIQVHVCIKVNSGISGA